MTRIAILFSTLGVFLLVPAAFAGRIYGPSLRVSLLADGKTVITTVKVTAAYNSRGPQGFIVFSDCKYGQHTPLQLTNTTLPRNAQGLLVWRFANVPPKSDGPLTKILSFRLTQNKGGPTFCVKARMWAKGFGYYKPLSVTVKLP